MRFLSVMAFQLAALARAVAASGPLVGAKVMLFVNNITPTKSTTLTDLTEATFDGYAVSAALTWGTPFIGADGLAHISAPSVLFICTGLTTPETVYGAAIILPGTPDKLELVMKFDSPVPMTVIGDGVIVQPDLAYGW